MDASQQWHVAHWPPLAWLETGIKLVALGIGVGTAVATLSTPNFAFPNGLHLVQFIILIVLSLGLIAAIFDRIADREIIAMGFVVLNNLGHWGMVLALASTNDLGGVVPLFAGLMLLGDLVKVWFIKAENFTVRDFPQRTLYILTGVYIVGYALILILGLFLSIKKRKMMRSERKLAANRFWFFAAISIILLQTIACSSAQGTSTATAVPQPTSPPQENTATPPPSPELQINGEQILQESIAAVNELEAYKMSMVIGGDFGEGNADCNILSEDNQWLCQHNVVLASGEKDQSSLYQSANNSWYKEDPSEIPWFFVSEGFKVGYSGVNDYALIKQIIETEETIFESQPAIHIHYDFEPERFLSLMLNNLTAVPAYINQANEITIEGNSYIDPDTKLPIKEDITVAIESNITPLHLTYELSYDFITPVEIEKPVGEDLLEISNQFFTALADERYDTAYSYFATLAKEQITVDDLATLVETNKELFTDFQQLRLLQFDNAPEIPNLDGEFILMLVEAQFTDGSTQQFRLLFIKEDQNWLLGRFDAAVSTNG